MAGFAGGFTFPMLIYINLVTGMAGGEPRRGLEGVLACISIYLSLAPPILALHSPLITSLGVMLSGAASAAYTALQLGRPRMAWRPFAPLLIAPPLGGVAGGLVAMAAGEELVGVASLAAAGFTLPMIMLLSPATVGSVYGVRARTAQPLSLPASASPLLAPALGWEAALRASIFIGLLYLVIILSNAPRVAGSGGARLYIVLSHAAAFTGALPGLLLSGVPLLHSAYLGFAAPHALMHVMVRGGEVPFTVRPRFWPFPSPILLAASALARPLEPLASWLLALSAFLLAMASLANREPVPPAFKREQDIRLNYQRKP